MKPVLGLDIALAGSLGQAKETPADVASIPYFLVAVKRCPACASGLGRRAVKQTCEACGPRLMDDPSFAGGYIASIDRRVPVVPALASFQWVPAAGAFAPPAMALINYVAYRTAYKKSASGA